MKLVKEGITDLSFGKKKIDYVSFKPLKPSPNLEYSKSIDYLIRKTINSVSSLLFSEKPPKQKVQTLSMYLSSVTYRDKVYRFTLERLKINTNRRHAHPLVHVHNTVLITRCLDIFKDNIKKFVPSMEILKELYRFCYDNEGDEILDPIIGYLKKISQTLIEEKHTGINHKTQDAKTFTGINTTNENNKKSHRKKESKEKDGKKSNVLFCNNFLRYKLKDLHSSKNSFVYSPLLRFELLGGQFDFNKKGSDFYPFVENYNPQLIAKHQRQIREKIIESTNRSSGAEQIIFREIEVKVKRVDLLKYKFQSNVDKQDELIEKKRERFQEIYEKILHNTHTEEEANLFFSLLLSIYQGKNKSEIDMTLFCFIELIDNSFLETNILTFRLIDGLLKELVPKNSNDVRFKDKKFFETELSAKLRRVLRYMFYSKKEENLIVWKEGIKVVLEHFEPHKIKRIDIHILKKFFEVSLVVPNLLGSNLNEQIIKESDASRMFKILMNSLYFKNRKISSTSSIQKINLKLLKKIGGMKFIVETMFLSNLSVELKTNLFIVLFDYLLDKIVRNPKIKFKEVDQKFLLKLLISTEFHLYFHQFFLVVHEDLFHKLTVFFLSKILIENHEKYLDVNPKKKPKYVRKKGKIKRFSNAKDLVIHFFKELQITIGKFLTMEQTIKKYGYKYIRQNNIKRITLVVERIRDGTELFPVTLRNIDYLLFSLLRHVSLENEDSGKGDETIEAIMKYLGKSRDLKLRYTFLRILRRYLILYKTDQKKSCEFLNKYVKMFLENVKLNHSSSLDLLMRVFFVVFDYITVYVNRKKEKIRNADFMDKMTAFLHSNIHFSFSLLCMIDIKIIYEMYKMLSQIENFNREFEKQRQTARIVVLILMLHKCEKQQNWKPILEIGGIGFLKSIIKKEKNEEILYYTSLFIIKFLEDYKKEKLNEMLNDVLITEQNENWELFSNPYYKICHVVSI